MSNKTYDRFKFLAQIGLPALATLYFTLAGIWGLPAAEQVVGTIVAIDTFLGVLLQLSSIQHKENFDGEMIVEETVHGKKFTLELNKDPEELDQQDKVIFKVPKRE